MKKRSFWVLLSLLVLVGLASAGCVAPPFSSPPSGYPYGPGGGGMMGPGGMMGTGQGGPGGGMMEPGGPYRQGGQRISLDKAVQLVQDYLRTRNDPDLKATEIMEFSYNFYVQFTEKSTGINAFEALIDPYTGDLYPEPGPNMMWNTKYGAMSGMMWGTAGSPGTPMTVTPDRAETLAQQFLDGYLPGAKAEEPEPFHGYYTLHVLKDNQIYGMLSVNGYTGQVWYHFWHGPYIGMRELS